MGELWCGGVAVWGSRGVGESRCGGSAVCGSCNVGQCYVEITVVTKPDLFAL